MMSRKYKTICATLTYIEHFFISTSAVAGCIYISAFASMLGIPIGIKSSGKGLKICAIVAEMKKYKSLIKKKKKRDKIVFNMLATSKFSRTEDLISKALID